MILERSMDLHDNVIDRDDSIFESIDSKNIPQGGSRWFDSNHVVQNKKHHLL